MHHDETTLELLRTAARERDPLADPRWDALTRGELSATELEELRAFAKEHDLEAALEAFAPAPEGSNEALTDAVFAARTKAESALNEASTRGDTGPSTPKPMGRVIPSRRVVYAVVAAAAALFLFFRPTPDSGDVASYSLVLTGGTAVTRSTDTTGELPKLAAGSSLDVVLRPQTPEKSDVSARAFLLRGGRATPWNVTPTVAEGGALRIQGATDVLFAGVEKGRVGLVFFVGHPSALSDVEALQKAAESGKIPPHTRLLRQPVELADPPPEGPANDAG